ASRRPDRPDAADSHHLQRAGRARVGRRGAPRSRHPSCHRRALRSGGRHRRAPPRAPAGTGGGMSRTTVVLAPNPGIYTGPGTNSYLVGEGDELICIDPGPDEPAHLAALLAAATRRGGRISRILLTHSHPDHRPLAKALAEAT